VKVYDPTAKSSLTFNLPPPQGYSEYGETETSINSVMVVLTGSTLHGDTVRIYTGKWNSLNETFFAGDEL
jgi:hypothetical protein